MSKTIALRTELQRLLKTLTDNVYFEEASEKAYPYAVFELSELTHDYGKTLMQLEVNVLDHGKDSSRAEILADNIQTALHKYFYIGSEIEFTAYEGLRQTVKEEDKDTIRRRLLFEIQLHEKKGE